MKKNKNEKLNNHGLKILLLLTIILILAALLRFYHLGNRPLYLDEPRNTVDIAAKPLSFIITTNYGSNVYPLLLHFLLPLGNTEFMARLPAALFGLLSVLGVFLVGKWLFGKKEGIIAALLLAVSTHNIYFSQQARGYSGLMMFSLFSLYFFLKALKENRVLFWGLYVLFTMVNIYTHLFALITIPVHVFFISILMFEKWVQKKKKKTEIITKRRLIAFALCTLLILIITFFIYFPTKNHSTGPMFAQSAKNIFKFKTTLSFSSVVSETLKRQLEYYTSHPLFFAKLLLFLIGVLGSLKNQRRELILFLSYLILPFSIFFLSNPPPMGYLPADNKFIFILPILLLLIAKGVVIIYSIFVEALSRLTKIKKVVPLRNAVFALFVLIILLVESVFVKDYYLQFWRIRSLDRSKEVTSFLKKHVQSEEIILFDNFLNKSNLLQIRPLFYPGHKKKGVMIQELSNSWVEKFLSEKPGLWVVFDRLPLTDETRSNLKKLSDDIEIKTLSQSSIVHFQSRDQTLIEKLSEISHFFIHLPIEKEEKIEYHLLLAKLNLLAKRNEEALRELENMDKIRDKPSFLKHDDKRKNLIYNIADKLFGLKKRDYHRIVQNLLYDEVSNLLFTSGNQLYLDGKYNEAIPLQKKAVEFNPKDFGLHLSLAESYERAGMMDEASHEYKKALKLNINPKHAARIISKIRDLHPLSAGYIIWSQENIWHIRWWSNKKRVFSGTITASRPIKQVEEYKLKRNDDYEVQGKCLTFRGIVKKRKIEGLDIITRAHSKLKLDLMIDNNKNVMNKIILTTEEKHPKGMPFLLQ